VAIVMPRRRKLTGVFACAGLTAIAPLAGAVVRLPTDFINEVLVSNLNEPTSFAFLPDGRVLLTEQRTGKLRLVVNGHLAATDPVLVVPQLSNGGYEAGLQGVAVDPRWPSRPYVYLFHNRTGSRLRLVRYTATGDLTSPFGESLSFSSPLLLIDDITDFATNHNGGCLRFAPDSALFLSLGDDQNNNCEAADSTTLMGALLRLDVMRLGDGGGGPVPRDSITPADNPLVTTDPNARLVYAYGVRNPWRFQIDPFTGTVYLADVGLDTREEINEVHGGEFLGWPWREGNVSVFVGGCPEPGGSGAVHYVPPIVSMSRGGGSVAIVSAGMYRPEAGAPANWPPQYDGDVFYGEHYSGTLRRIEWDGSAWKPAAPEPGQPDATNWGTGLSFAVDYLVGPDGSLWWLRRFQNEEDEGVTGSLQRIRFVGQTTAAPQGARTAIPLASRPNPFSATTELSFRLTAQGYVRLELLDLSGRMVRRLLDASVPAGEHRERWDGRDAAGRAVPPGVYLARFESPQGVGTQRLLRLR
jgi:glucose/arabinose dehydrogenase